MSVSQNLKKQLAQAMSEALYEFSHCHFKETTQKCAQLKRLSKKFSKKIQKDVLKLTTQIDIQKDYIPQHGITKEVKKLADQIIKDLSLKI